VDARLLEPDTKVETMADDWHGDAMEGDTMEGDAMELDSREYPDEDENDDDDHAVVLPCPACGAEINEEAPQCPVCGTYITHGASIWTGRPVWWIVLGALGILAVVLTLFIGFF
jgi:hypothetical protein